MTTAYQNRIATAVPEHDVHDAFVHAALSGTQELKHVFWFLVFADGAAASLINACASRRKNVQAATILNDLRLPVKYHLV